MASGRLAARWVLERRLAAPPRERVEVAVLPEDAVVFDPFAGSVDHPPAVVTRQEEPSRQPAARAALAPGAAGQTLQQIDETGAAPEIGVAGIELKMPAAAVAMGDELVLAEIVNAQGQGLDRFRGLQLNGFAEQRLAAHRTHHRLKASSSDAAAKNPTRRRVGSR